MPPIPIQSPTGYTVGHAVAFADAEGSAVIVSSATPLPVSATPAASIALAGTTAASGIQGPFVPVIGRAVVLALSGSWAGTIKVLRSTDGGSTKLPLTIGGAAWAQFTGNACEPVWEESEPGARLYLDLALTSGTVAYRLAQ